MKKTIVLLREMASGAGSDAGGGGDFAGIAQEFNHQF